MEDRIKEYTTEVMSGVVDILWPAVNQSEAFIKLWDDAFKSLDRKFEQFSDEMDAKYETTATKGIVGIWLELLLKAYAFDQIEDEDEDG